MHAKALSTLVVLLALTGLASPASAHYAHRHHGHRIHWSSVPKTPEWPHSTAFGPRWSQNAERPHVTVGEGRSSRWCGWYMRQVKGISDASYNLARNWISYGHPSGPVVGAVVVWPHHVGEIAAGECPAGHIMLHSGNDGHAVRTRCVSLRGVIAFRD
jgi:hypothetical protein